MPDIPNPRLPVHGETVSIRQGLETLEGYLAVPVGEFTQRPAVLVLHEVWGLDDHIRSVARRIAGEGYVALAPNLFSREGPPPGTTIEELRPFMFRIPDLRVVKDLEAGITFLRANPLVSQRPIGAVGFCIGGTWARMLAIREGSLAAVVDFYGRLRYPELSDNKPFQPIDRVAEMCCPYLGLFGGEDPVIPSSDLEELRWRLESAHRAFDIKVYPGAPHAFFNDSRALYQDPPAEIAWRDTTKFLSQHLG
jgi:carboxymethylenebutenolidase